MAGPLNVESWSLNEAPLKYSNWPSIFWRPFFQRYLL